MFLWKISRAISCVVNGCCCGASSTGGVGGGFNAVAVEARLAKWVGHAELPRAKEGMICRRHTRANPLPASILVGGP